MLLSKALSTIIKSVLIYLFILGAIKLLFLIDDIFYFAENVTNKIWNYIGHNIGISVAAMILMFLTLLYLLLPPYEGGWKTKLLSLFEIISTSLKKSSKLLSAFYYLYDIEYLIEVVEGKSAKDLPNLKEKIKIVANYNHNSKKEQKS